jgi:hypothetical protein
MSPGLKNPPLFAKLGPRLVSKNALAGDCGWEGFADHLFRRLRPHSNQLGFSWLKVRGRVVTTCVELPRIFSIFAYGGGSLAVDERHEH